MAAQRLRAAIKYVASFLKGDWELRDYPIRFRRVGSERESTHRELLRRALEAKGGSIEWDCWNAQIVNWWQMCGGGQTRDEAYENLAANFENYRQTGRDLPRPGARVPIELCPSDAIDRYHDIASEFFRRILDVDYDDPLFVVTDASSLWEFTLFHDVTEEELVARVRTEYRVDISDIKDGNLVAVLQRIQEKGSA